jgi:hypothetical protein
MNNAVNHVRSGTTLFQAVGAVPNAYATGARVMAKVESQPAWYDSNRIVAGLLAALLILVGIIYANMKGDIDDLKKDSKEIIRQSSDMRVDLVKAISSVEKQGAATNARLDQLISDGRQRR